MFKIKPVRNVMATTIMVGAIVSLAQACYAQSGLHLEARLESKRGATGQAAFFESKTENVLVVSTKGWKPGTMQMVTVRRGKNTQKIAVFKTDRRGSGGVKVSSRDFRLPVFQQDDLVQVLYGDHVIASGRFRLTK